MMRITRIVIDNYKSIKHIDINLSSKVNAFIGENSVGKSNILSAIEWMLGPVYPSFNNFSREDYYKGDVTLRVSITVYFDDGNYLQLTNKWYDRYQNEKSGLNINGGYVTDDVRQKYTSAFIGADRKVNDNPASNRWTLLGRLLRDINERFAAETMIDPISGEPLSKSDYFKRNMETMRDNVLFSVEDDDGNNMMEQFVNILRTETASQLGREPSDFNVDLNMYDPWNLFRTLQIMVNEEDTGLTFRASELGMGVQASITIAILKAYSKLKLNNNTPIIIDEPELFLHPQGRRNFYKIISELADSGTQVILTTHSSEFISLARFDEIFVVRKNKEKGTYIRNADPQRFLEDLKQRHPQVKTNTSDLMLEYLNAYEGTGDSQRASEAMFARKAILVEGESEVLILPYFFDLLGYNYIRKGITIVRCGGKSEIDRFYRLYSEFGIPCFIVFDGDYQNLGSGDEKSTIDKNKGILGLFGITDNFPDDNVYDRFLGFKYRLEENLGIGDVGNAKALKLYKRVRSSIKTKEQVPEWVKKVIDKIDSLPSEAPSILKEAPKDVSNPNTPFGF